MYHHPEIETQVSRILKRCIELGITLSTAESCTGGMIAAALTNISGSSAVFDRGYITYSNQSKYDLLGVSLSLIDLKGAVSEEVALAMAEGALARSGTTLSLSITGITGPTGGSSSKPVGLIYYGIAKENQKSFFVKKNFSDSLSRTEIRFLTLTCGLTLIEQNI